jgi:hypothetical protein
MTRLTDADRRILAKARELTAVNTMDRLREHTGASDTEVALTAGWGESAYLLRELAAIIGRLDDGGALEAARHARDPGGAGS